MNFNHGQLVCKFLSIRLKKILRPVINHLYFHLFCIFKSLGRKHSSYTILHKGQTLVRFGSTVIVLGHLRQTQKNNQIIEDCPPRPSAMDNEALQTG